MGYSGRFNIVLKPEEKIGGKRFNNIATKDMYALMEGIHVIDLGWSGYPSTFKRDQLHESLDWVLVNVD